MNKPKKKKVPPKRAAEKAAAPPKKEQEDGAQEQQSTSQAIRETVESVVVAVILAFLFRAFIAEAFVIPTGSMAPVLQGRHKDVACSQCGYQYRAGASLEAPDRGARPSTIVGTMCPICRYPMELELERDLNHASFSGDRILVSKFSYDLSEPERWDVIVFKYPNNAKQNYIKRLIGLPGETIEISNGDIFVRKSGEKTFSIARKPDHKLWAMMQLIDDTQFISPRLKEAGWPLRWAPFAQSVEDNVWSTPDQGETYLAEQGDAESWLRFQYIIPYPDDWAAIEERPGQVIPEFAERNPQLITDFYAYNAYTQQTPQGAWIFGNYQGYEEASTFGLNWVGDLALEANLEVQSEEGELLLDLVEGGVHFTCRIQVPTGEVKLSIVNSAAPFDGGQLELTGKCAIRKPGRYRVRFANVDDEVRLWVNRSRVEFDSPATYLANPHPRPYYGEDDPGDAAPIGVGTKGLQLKLERLRVYRDVYYVANGTGTMNTVMFGSVSEILADTDVRSSEQVLSIIRSPETWKDTPIFGPNSRNRLVYQMDEGQYFPLGDNSPQSADARSWGMVHYVDKELMIGKAIMIYWPHPWYKPIPYLPNFGRMGLIR